MAARRDRRKDIRTLYGQRLANSLLAGWENVQKGYLVHVLANNLCSQKVMVSEGGPTFPVSSGTSDFRTGTALSHVARDMAAWTNTSVGINRPPVQEN